MTLPPLELLAPRGLLLKLRFGVSVGHLKIMGDIYDCGASIKMMVVLRFERHSAFYILSLGDELLVINLGANSQGYTGRRGAVNRPNRVPTCHVCLPMFEKFLLLLKLAVEGFHQPCSSSFPEKNLFAVKSRVVVSVSRFCPSLSQGLLFTMIRHGSYFIFGDCRQVGCDRRSSSSHVAALFAIIR